MEPIIICFGCRQRVSRQEIASGQHRHGDVNQPQPNATTPTKLSS